jgi:hypothetical protein
MDQENSVRREEVEEFDFSEEVNEIFSGSEIKSIKPLKSEVNNPIYYPVYEPFRPDEAILPNKVVKEFLHKEATNEKRNIKEENINLAARKHSANISSTALPLESLVLHNTSPAPAAFSQPPRPAYPPPVRAPRSDSSPISVGHHYESSQQPHRQQSLPSSSPKSGKNPLAFLLPGTQQNEAKSHQQPRIEVMY